MMFRFGTPDDPNLIGPAILIGLAIIAIVIDTYFFLKRSKEPGFDPWSEI